MANGFTPYSEVYDVFLSKITDDMYMELDEAQTKSMLKELLKNAIHWFEFPRCNLTELGEDSFKCTLTTEEANIIATYMVVEWLGQQLATVELVRMKYSSADYKFTSQAGHLQKLNVLRREYEKEGFHLQRLYKRRKIDKDGVVRSTFGAIMGRGE